MDPDAAVAPLHPDLAAVFGRLLERLRADPRCLGVYLRGSLATGEADAHSDVDACVIVAEADYAGFKAGLLGLCRDSCGSEPVAWFCKSEREAYTDYAVLLDAAGDGALLAMDLSVNTPKALSLFPVAADQFVFDRDGSLTGTTRGATGESRAFSAGEVRRLAEEFWVHVHLNAKYLPRGDLFKLLHVQRSLCDLHARTLNALCRPHERWAWWPGEVKRLPAVKQRAVLTYFGAASVAQVALALRQEMSTFSADARSACALHGAEYPAALEAGVRRSLDAALEAAAENATPSGGSTVSTFEERIREDE